MEKRKYKKEQQYLNKTKTTMTICEDLSETARTAIFKRLEDDGLKDVLDKVSSNISFDSSLMLIRESDTKLLGFLLFSKNTTTFPIIEVTYMYTCDEYKNTELNVFLTNYLESYMTLQFQSNLILEVHNVFDVFVANTLGRNSYLSIGEHKYRKYIHTNMNNDVADLEVTETIKREEQQETEKVPEEEMVLNKKEVYILDDHNNLLIYPISEVLNFPVNTKIERVFMPMYSSSIEQDIVDIGFVTSWLYKRYQNGTPNQLLIIYGNVTNEHYYDSWFTHSGSVFIKLEEKQLVNRDLILAMNYKYPKIYVNAYNDLDLITEGQFTYLASLVHRNHQVAELEDVLKYLNHEKISELTKKEANICISLLDKTSTLNLETFCTYLSLNLARRDK